MSLVLEQAKFLSDIAKLIQYINSKNLLVTGKELLRTPEQQSIYIKTGRSTTYNSKHLKSCAIDLYIFTVDCKLVTDDKILKDIGDFWESIDKLNSWGGNWSTFKDKPHFERKV